jgi:hypothetical protein
MQAFHVGPEREWEDIAYHFLVDSEGGVWAGRPPDVRGNPSVYYDAMGLVLICFLGDFDQQQPTEPQLVAAAKTAGWIIWRYGLPPQPQTMLSHCDRAPTACPGQSILQVMHDGSFVTRVLESLPRRA